MLFSSSPNMKEIDFSLNQIVEFKNDTFKNLNQIEKIALNDNKIIKIPPFAFSTLSTLQKLFLDIVSQVS